MIFFIENKCASLSYFESGDEVNDGIHKSAGKEPQSITDVNVARES